ncbi:GDSL-type esterase/lipase family protein [Acetobacterium wieringae]|uniref:GDSL-type esterase/lipase family protein n=1 Tax=Acetobacterium wieringae TaxID=52694 RepID=UPI002033C80F|nr:GDSL-type esterase/lipase family protein [Acetobacterium wieringae]URN83443.1 GDSL-type esterase/lipase family protein [Acetobacterium wieringae]
MYKKQTPPFNKSLAVFILIPCIIIIVVLLIHYQSVARENAKVTEGIQALATLETRDLYTMEEKIDYMKRKAIDSGDYSALFGNAVVFGDSIAEGLGLYGFLSPTSLVAVMGKSTENSLEDVPSLVNLAPRNVFFELGLNDISHPDSTLDSYLSHYEKIIDAVRLQLPNTQIYLCSIFPVTDEALKEKPEFSQIETYNTALEEMAKRKNIHYIDTYTFLKNNPQYHEQDGIHVIREFYPIWMDTLVNNSDLKNLL